MTTYCFVIDIPSVSGLKEKVIAALAGIVDSHTDWASSTSLMIFVTSNKHENDALQDIEALMAPLSGVKVFKTTTAFPPKAKPIIDDPKFVDDIADRLRKSRDQGGSTPLANTPRND